MSGHGRRLSSSGAGGRSRSPGCAQWEVFGFYLDADMCRTSNRFLSKFNELVRVSFVSLSLLKLSEL